MDSHQFDDLTRSLAIGLSRRRAMKVLASGAAGGLAAFLGRHDAAAGKPCATDKDCPKNQSCATNNRCTHKCDPALVPLCPSCQTPVCTSTGYQCQAANDGADCSYLGTTCGVCQSGQCAFTCSACQICGSGGCISDPGKNGTACGTGGACCAGSCCAVGQECCAGCQPACPSGQTRNQTTCRCECPSGTMLCNGQCYSTDCGACGSFDGGTCQCVSACASGTSCCNGGCVLSICTVGKSFNTSTCQCECSPGTVACGGNCVAPCDTSRCEGCDAASGSCRSSCTGTQTCVNGSCAETCAAGTIPCGNQCCAGPNANQSALCCEGGCCVGPAGASLICTRDTCRNEPLCCAAGDSDPSVCRAPSCIPDVCCKPSG